MADPPATISGNAQGEAVNRPIEVNPAGVTSIWERFSAVAGQSERTILLGTVLLASTVFGTLCFVLARYYPFDAFSFALYPPKDCWLDWGMNVGRHCFGDYAMAADAAMRPNPWAPYPIFIPPDNQPMHNAYTAAAMVPHVTFGLLGKWVGAPRVGLFGYLLVLTIAVLSPAVWATRGARGLERAVVFVVCGVVAVPMWTVIDRANSVGFVAPIALVFLVALCRRRWGIVTIMVVLATLIKPQFAILVVVLFAARQWRLGGIAVVGGLISNVAAYALWPRDFPATIVQSVHNAFGYGSFFASAGTLNASFEKGLLVIPDVIADRGNGGPPDGFLAGPRSLIGYAVLLVVVVSVLVLGRRILPVMAGTALLATASLFPAVSNTYYLVFVLPVAALVVRDPDGPPGSGFFDRLATSGDRRRAVGICVTLAVALSIAQISLANVYFPTTVVLAPTAWLVACAAIIVSYARRPADCCAAAGAAIRPASSEPAPAAVL